MDHGGLDGNGITVVSFFWDHRDPFEGEGRSHVSRRTEVS